jgi:mannose-6-phosphate isomerase
MLYPLRFQPIFKERIWGGRNLERLYGKSLPAGARIGESWEIVDREDENSVVANGPLAGKTLRWLMEQHGEELLGPIASEHERFPLLVKILDAQEKLSLQVHPPEEVAQELGGEPKTEFWYITDTAPGAELYAGLKKGTTREEFQRRLRDGTVAESFHRIRVEPGNAMFLPSGRVHALGAGIVLFEIQQNSDSTYRVFDWNRMDESGKARDLHVEQSLRSIYFQDFEPSLIQPDCSENEGLKVCTLARDPLFCADLIEAPAGARLPTRPETMEILGVVRGRLALESDTEKVNLGPGDFCLVPSSLMGVRLQPTEPAAYLEIWPGQAGSA